MGSNGSFKDVHSKYLFNPTCPRDLCLTCLKGIDNNLILKWLQACSVADSWLGFVQRGILVFPFDINSVFDFPDTSGLAAGQQFVVGAVLGGCELDSHTE